MEEAMFSPGTMLENQLDSAMDFDYMDDLFSQGCWLETIDGSELPAFLDSSFPWPALDAINTAPSANQSQQINREERPDGVFDMIGNVNGDYNYENEGSEPSKRWYIGPKSSLSPANSVMQRLICALGFIKDLTHDKNVLIQLWLPVNRAGRRVLTTYDQPFSIDYNNQRLISYRDVSVNYYFSAEEGSNEAIGLPGRVYLGKVPEWSPDVQLFRSDEFSRVDHAQQCDVRGTLALPVFEQGSRSCLGVIEVVMTTRRIKYRSELESVCKALEAFDLRSSDVQSVEKTKACNQSYQAALSEIQLVLRTACESHKLPLAQTWVSCTEQGKGGSRHTDENVMHCISTVDQACYVADPDMWSFHEACSEHHLLKGEGVAGKALLTNEPCFSADITSFKKTEYPLAHHAKMFGLCGAVAIRLRSIHTGTADFVLEFFLPKSCRDAEEQRKLLGSLSVIIQHVCRTLRVVTDEELKEETRSSIAEVVLPSDVQEKTINVEEKRSWSGCLKEVQNICDVESFDLKDESSTVALGENSLINEQYEKDFSLKGNAECNVDSNSGDGSSYTSLGVGKNGEKKRTKAEKTITLQVLRQYFAGSLKDAAKSIGVCPTTLKRICRQHGIQRWPSRQIKKVGHSLQKLQLVMDSVQGASGTLPIGSFYTNFPELASPNKSATSPHSTSKSTDQSKPVNTQNKCCVLSPAQDAKSPSSSCSQSSTSSSQCCSNGTTQMPPAASNIARTEDPMVGDSSSDLILKRVRSDFELHTSKQAQQPLPRSKSYKSITEHPTQNRTNISQEVDTLRVKVTYGNEIIRFRMQQNWKLQDLLDEISRRFSIDNMQMIDLKYLDDDSEWVLLTCDADLEECIDVFRSSQGQTIKLSVQVSHHHSERFFGTSGS